MAALVVGSNPRFRLTALKDGVVWDISAASVSLYLRKPDGSVLTNSAAVSNGPAGMAQFDSAVTDLDQPGFWTRSWRVTDGPVSLECVAIPFVVEDSPW